MHRPQKGTFCEKKPGRLARTTQRTWVPWPGPLVSGGRPPRFFVMLAHISFKNRGREHLVGGAISPPRIPPCPRVIGSRSKKGRRLAGDCSNAPRPCSSEGATFGGKPCRAWLAGIYCGALDGKNETWKADAISMVSCFFENGPDVMINQRRVDNISREQLCNPPRHSLV
ncbi:hypothetical protein LZ31DRAFT_128598 [Colletotrichum somersetense]|nr:hypothetical protein LZ31DRAFT_128598 [Colletotrichum somersetense]